MRAWTSVQQQWDGPRCMPSTSGKSHRMRQADSPAPPPMPPAPQPTFMARGPFAAGPLVPRALTGRSRVDWTASRARPTASFHQDFPSAAMGSGLGGSLRLGAVSAWAGKQLGLGEKHLFAEAGRAQSHAYLVMKSHNHQLRHRVQPWIH